MEKEINENKFSSVPSLKRFNSTGTKLLLAAYLQIVFCCLDRTMQTGELFIDRAD
jgi:hypothetical protein